MSIPVITNITLDMAHPNEVVVWAKQNDKLSRKINAQLTAAGVAWTPPTAIAILRYRKPDGTAGFYDTDEAGSPAVVISGTTASITLAEQALVVPGVVDYELNFYTATQRLTSFSFRVNVERSAIDDATIVSSDYFNALTEAVTEAIEVLKGIHGVPTGGVDGQYLAKAGAEDYSAEWRDLPSPIPEGGIQKSDLAAAVQSSLTKADSALQTVPSGYATKEYVNNHHDSSKQDKLTPGNNITIVGGVISAEGGGMEVRTEIDATLEPNTRYVLTDFFTSGTSPVFLFPYSANDGDVIELNWENTYEQITYSDNISELLQFGYDEPYCQLRAVYDSNTWVLSKVGRMYETDPTVPAWAKRSTKPTYTASEVGALPVSGGTVTGSAQFNASVGFVGTAYHYGVIVLNENSFGDTLPASGVEGQLFFLKRQ